MTFCWQCAWVDQCPHWLVLSVAVVLRGNLAQTLARRNQRVGGTLLGCLLVVGLARLPVVPWQGLVFLLAVGTAHAFVVRRYWLAAAAATVMALLQAQLMHPAGGLTVAERVADTVLGALSAAAQRSAAERRRAPQRTPAHSPGAEAARPWPAADGAPVAGTPRPGRVMGCQCWPRADR